MVLRKGQIASSEHNDAKVGVTIGDLKYIRDQVERSSLQMRMAARSMVEVVRTLQTHNSNVTEVVQSIGQMIDQRRPAQ